MALAGLLVGHWLTYLAAIPDGHARDHVLRASGHGYWLVAVKAAVVLGVVALATIFLRYLVGHVRRDAPAPARLARLVARLSVIQAVPFVAMEATERMAAHAPIREMFGHALFARGLVIQLLLAWVGALLLLWLSRAAERVAVAVARRPHERGPVLRVVFVPPVHPIAVSTGEPLTGAATLRGPPPR